MNIKMMLPFRHAALVLTALLMTGCDTKAARVEAAFAEYQAAAARGDLRGTRNGLLKLVAADEDVPEYWVELGKVQIGLGAISDAYYAYTRALELDRDNPEVLSMLTQVALRSGELELAEDYAHQLELLVPNDSSVKLTYGIIALRRGDLKAASDRASQIMANQPNSSDAKVLQSQVLMKMGRVDEAVALLSKQVQTRPKDVTSHRALASIYDRLGDFRKAAETRKAIWNLDRTRHQSAIDYVEAALRAGDIAGARAASIEMMQPDAPIAVVQAMLDHWRQLWPGTARLQEARRLAGPASRDQKLVYATFFNDVGSPTDAIRLVASEARVPVSSANIIPNSIMATSLLLGGNFPEADRRIEGILEIDPDNVDALRSRAKLKMARKQPGSALNDARKVVSLSPGTAGDRVLLAQIHQANGDRRAAGRVLWEAFRDLQGNEEIHQTLRKYLARSDDIEAIRKVDREFEDQRQAMITKEFA